MEEKKVLNEKREIELYSIDISNATYQQVLGLLEKEDTFNYYFEPKIERYDNKVYLIFYG
jgi:hypothetical protein